MKLLTDENFDGRVIRAFRQRCPTADLVRAIDEGLGGSDDPSLLAWAADHDRILLTHDVSTMQKFAYARGDAGLPMPGVIEVPKSLTVRQIVDDLEMFLGASLPGEWEGQVLYLPF
jgi:hypothetical protein